MWLILTYLRHRSDYVLRKIDMSMPKVPRWYRSGETISTSMKDIDKDHKREDSDSKFVYIFAGERKWMLITGGFLLFLAAFLLLLWYSNIDLTDVELNNNFFKYYIPISFLLLVICGIFSIARKSWGISIILGISAFLGTFFPFFKVKIWRTYLHFRLRSFQQLWD